MLDEMPLWIWYSAGTLSLACIMSVALYVVRKAGRVPIPRLPGLPRPGAEQVAWVITPLLVLLFVYYGIGAFFPETLNRYVASGGPVWWVLIAGVLIGGIRAYAPRELRWTAWVVGSLMGFIVLVFFVPALAGGGGRQAQPYATNTARPIPCPGLKSPFEPIGPNRVRLNPNGQCALDIWQEGPGCIYMWRAGSPKREGPFCKGASNVGLPRDVEWVASVGTPVLLSWELSPPRFW